MLHATTQRELVAVIARYRDVVANGGWSTLVGLQEFELGKAHDKVSSLRARLAAEQYLTREQAAGATYDTVVAAALHRFQHNHGLAERDGIDRMTLAELNMPAGVRLAQLESTLARLQQLKLAGIDLAKEPYVLLNIPASEVQFVEDGRVVSSRRAIVGKPKTPSPELVGFIPSITLNPTWTVPSSIVRKEIAPMLRRNPGYLDRHGMRVERHGVATDRAYVNWRDQANIVVQRPGAQNSLGFLRINMRNYSRAAVYLHDTPMRKLFDTANRYYSHGCARVQDVVGFAESLLRETDAALTKEALTAEIKQHDGGWQPGRTINLKRPIRVIWAYMTAWVGEDGNVAFRKDVYRRDKPAVPAPTARQEMSGIPPASAKP
jgi:L,D-transpeptidase YcbB